MQEKPTQLEEVALFCNLMCYHLEVSDFNVGRTIAYGSVCKYIRLGNSVWEMEKAFFTPVKYKKGTLAYPQAVGRKFKPKDFGKLRWYCAQMKQQPPTDDLGLGQIDGYNTLEKYLNHGLTDEEYDQACYVPPEKRRPKHG